MEVAMRKKVTLITGVSGEVGLALVKSLAETGNNGLLTLDIRPIPAEYEQYSEHIQGDILDKALLNRLVSEYEIVSIFHMAALLSTRGEFTPVAAHQVNVEGTMGLLQLAAEQSEWRGDPVMFIFPSSIAVYGMPDLETKKQYPRVREWEWNYPITMYGCNKLYCEMLGTYFCSNYRQLAAERPQMLDFRCVRFPGLISAFTVPSGGTSDYGPEMLHAAAKDEPYGAFVRPDTQISFMAMPDAIKALLLLSKAPKNDLNRMVYNVTSYSLTAEQFRDQVMKSFSGAKIEFNPDLKRQRIVDTWPADLNDNDAHRDWGWEPSYDIERSFEEYLVPNILRRYRN
jgi:nucleoside-diphosphate-sugar epimerase